MTLHIKPRHLAVAVVVGALLAGGGYAFATTREHVIHACISRTRVLSVPASGRCGKRSIALAWNQQGPRGATGAKGARGASGSPGTPATVSVGAVTTGAAGSQASVTNVGSAPNAKLDFTIPQGPPGTNGTDGSKRAPRPMHRCGWDPAQPNWRPTAITTSSVRLRVGLAPRMSMCRDVHLRPRGAGHKRHRRPRPVRHWAACRLCCRVGCPLVSPIHHRSLSRCRPSIRPSGSAVNSDFSITVIC